MENGMKTEVFLSPKFELKPGSVANKYYSDIDFPRGHIAVKRFNAEVVDEQGNSIPLHETYLHHWIVLRYYQRKNLDVPKQNGDMGFLQSDYIVIKNSGVCDSGLSQTWIRDSSYRHLCLMGLKSEILKKSMKDMKSVGCLTCMLLILVVLWIIWVVQSVGVTLNGYIGGLRCCHDGMRCSVKEGFNDVKRGLYLKYTVEYLDWDQFIVPIEYDVESCPVEVANGECTHKRSLTVSLPTGGDVIYGVGHQHSGGIGTTLYGEGGRVICSSDPTYGKGDEPGNEAGYIVGMSTCYPSPGSIKISAGETLTLVSKYSSSQRHTGVMGLFYVLIADPFKAPNHIRHAPADMHNDMAVSTLSWVIALFGAAIIAVVIFVFQIRTGRQEGYEAITP